MIFFKIGINVNKSLQGRKAIKYFAVLWMAESPARLVQLHWHWEYSILASGLEWIFDSTGGYGCHDESASTKVIQGAR